MNTSDPVITALSTLQATLQAEYRAAKERADRELGACRDKIRAVEQTLQMYTTTHNLPALTADSVLVEQIRLAQNQHVALRAIAEAKGGILRVPDAARLVIAAGLTKSTLRNASSHVYKLLNDDDDFKMEAPGTFRLLAIRDTNETEAKSERQSV